MPRRPKIVCLCGSTRFLDAYREANLKETLAGNIVLSIGHDTKSDDDLELSHQIKAELDRLHLAKIDMADEILVLNVGGYIGESTTNEILYAFRRRKRIRWLEPAPESFCFTRISNAVVAGVDRYLRAKGIELSMQDVSNLTTLVLDAVAKNSDNGDQENEED